MSVENNTSTLVSPRWIDRPVNIRGGLSNREPPIMVHGQQLSPNKIEDMELPAHLPPLPSPSELSRNPANDTKPSITLPGLPEKFKAKASAAVTSEIKLPDLPEIFKQNRSAQTSPVIVSPVKVKPQSVHTSPVAPVAAIIKAAPVTVSKAPSAQNSPVKQTVANSVTQAPSVHNSPTSNNVILPKALSTHNSPVTKIMTNNEVTKAGSMHNSPMANNVKIQSVQNSPIVIKTTSVQQTVVNNEVNKIPLVQNSPIQQTAANNITKVPSVHNSPVTSNLIKIPSVHNSPVVTKIPSTHNSPVTTGVGAAVAATALLTQLPLKATTPVRAPIPLAQTQTKLPTPKLPTPRLSTPSTNIQVKPIPLSQSQTKLPPLRQMPKFSNTTEIASPPRLQPHLQTPQNYIYEKINNINTNNNRPRLYINARAPTPSPRIEPILKPTLPILNPGIQSPSYLDSPIPHIGANPILPNRNNIQFTGRLPEYIPPFIAVNASIPMSNAEPRVSFPPSPAAVPPMPLAPGTVEYETKFIDLCKSFDTLKKRKPQHADKIIDPVHGDNLDVLKTRLKVWRNTFKKEDTAFRWQAYLTVGFLLLEFVSTKIHLPTSGFTMSQWIIMCDYEEMLSELGEDESDAEFMKGHAPLTKIMTTTFFYFGMFIVVKWLISFVADNKEWAKNLNDGLWQLMRGNPNPADKQEGPRMENNALARLLANVSTLLNTGNSIINNTNQAAPVPDKPPFSD